MDNKDKNESLVWVVGLLAVVGVLLMASKYDMSFGPVGYAQAIDDNENLMRLSWQNDALVQNEDWSTERENALYQIHTDLEQLAQEYPYVNLIQVYTVVDQLESIHDRDDFYYQLDLAYKSAENTLLN